MAFGKPFEVGNPGRPRGIRNSYLHTKAFREALKKAWDLYGEAALKIMAREDPSGFCKLFAHLEPKEFDVTHTAVAELPDHELLHMIEELRAQIAQQQQVPMLPNKVIEGEVINGG
jgi:hypothetical protein